MDVLGHGADPLSSTSRGLRSQPDGQNGPLFRAGYCSRTMTAIRASVGQDERPVTHEYRIRRTRPQLDLGPMAS
jgi:hypothetical protein